MEGGRRPERQCRAEDLQYVGRRLSSADMNPKCKLLAVLPLPAIRGLGRSRGGDNQNKLKPANLRHDYFDHLRVPWLAVLVVMTPDS
jgi:hypothetical protein